MEPELQEARDEAALEEPEVNPEPEHGGPDEVAQDPLDASFTVQDCDKNVIQDVLDRYA